MSPKHVHTLRHFVYVTKFKDFETGSLFWVIQMGLNCPHEPWKAENLSHLGSKGEMLYRKNGQRDAKIMNFKVEKRDTSQGMQIVSTRRKRQENGFFPGASGQEIIPADKSILAQWEQCWTYTYRIARKSFHFKSASS